MFKSSVWDKVPPDENNRYFWRYQNYLSAKCISRRSPLCQQWARSVQAFWQNSELWRTDGLTDRHKATANSAPAQRRAGNNWTVLFCSCPIRIVRRAIRHSQCVINKGERSMSLCVWLTNFRRSKLRTFTTVHARYATKNRNIGYGQSSASTIIFGDARILYISKRQRSRMLI